MSLILRYIYTILKALRRPAVEPLENCSLDLQVWPFDLDPNLHLNNGRFLSLMDLGRTDLVVRSGLGRVLWKKSWRPLVASAVIRFRGSLQPFQKFQLKTRIVGWDEKWFFIEQRFLANGKVAAVGAIKGLFRGPQGNISSPEVLAAVGVADLVSPELPEWLEAWKKAESTLIDLQAD
jgi:acyl-CoA thioesterase FadM